MQDWKGKKQFKDEKLKLEEHFPSKVTELILPFKIRSMEGYFQITQQQLHGDHKKGKSSRGSDKDVVIVNITCWKLAQTGYLSNWLFMEIVNVPFVFVVEEEKETRWIFIIEGRNKNSYR